MKPIAKPIKNRSIEANNPLLLKQGYCQRCGGIMVPCTNCGKPTCTSHKCGHCGW